HGGHCPVRMLKPLPSERDTQDRDGLGICCPSWPWGGHELTFLATDFVLVWETVPYELSRQQDSRKNRDLQERSATIHRTWRKKFRDELHAAGIHMEKKKVLHYLLLSAPWSVLCYYTEELQLRVPLQALPRQTSNWLANVLQQLSIPNLMAQEVPNLLLDYYTCPFKANKLCWFLGSNEQDTFFTTTQWHQILYKILAKTQYGHSGEQEVGVDWLLSENVFSAAFPLHEVRPCHPLGSRADQLAVHPWPAPWKWSKYHPLDHVCKYFGEKVAFYFAWLGESCLLQSTLTGCWCSFLARRQEICASEEQYWMCPLCKTCPYWQLSKISPLCPQAGRVFGHGGTIFFSTFVSLWAVLFLEFWKWTNTSLAHHWDCSEFEDIEERLQPQFAAMAPMTIINPVMGAEEPHFPKRRHLHRILAGSTVITMMIAIVVMFMVSIFLYQAVVAILLSSSGYFWSASRIASITSSVVNLIFILILSKICISLAHFLTKWEMQCTQTKYEDAFTFKVFVFQFVTFYSSTVYIAFFKGKFIGFPGNYLSFLGVRNKECSPGGCFTELVQELLVIMIGRHGPSHFPRKLKCWWHKHKLLSPKKAGKEGESVLVEQVPWVMDHQLLVFKGLFDKYLEMVLQFSFITIFVAACPLAPLFALLNNWVETGLDAHKFVCDYRQPMAEPVQGIGICFSTLEAIAHLAIISNAFLSTFTSDFLPHVYVNFTLAHAPWDFVLESNTTCRYRAFRDQNGNLTLTYWQLLAVRLGFIIVFEHVVFFIRCVNAWLVPDIPESVEVKVKRERYLAKKALAENKVGCGRDCETEQFASTWVPQHAPKPVAQCWD
uniref:Anoctamin n=1 Tax=Accipiter nisus TaxID=211598 RepID=A0A8B9M6C1_9AVES